MSAAAPEVLRLRPTLDADLPILYAQQQDPESCRLAGTKPRSWEAFESAIRRSLADPRTVGRTIVLERAGGEVVAGGISCFVVADEDYVGYGLAREHWGRGLASRALALLLAEVTRRPLRATAAAHNIASCRILGRCGFRVVGARMGEETDRYVGCEVIDFILE